MPELTDEQVRHMAERFASWRLPNSLRSDDCVTKDGETYPFGRFGTNIMTVAQAEQMVRHMIGRSDEAEAK